MPIMLLDMVSRPGSRRFREQIRGIPARDNHCPIVSRHVLARSTGLAGVGWDDTELGSAQPVRPDLLKRWSKSPEANPQGLTSDLANPQGLRPDLFRHDQNTFIR
jgi:hypothetical protein